ncbi:MAG: hypothetical protein Q7S16_00740 [bacterium]|nr:hypothetical protein [bacterium]
MHNNIEPKALGIKPEETLSDEQREKINRDAERDLAELGIESRPEHIEAVRAMMLTSNFPDGYEDVVQHLRSLGALKHAMEARGINSIIHAEGVTVWDHVKAVIKGVDALDVADNMKHDLRLILLYHDLGKVEVWSSEQNLAATKKHVGKGRLQRAMIGHADARADQMRTGLVSAGVDAKRLEQMMMVIKHHMNTSIPEQDPKKTVKLVQSFGETDADRQEVVQLLSAALYVDGNATEHVELHGGAFVLSKNQEKTRFDNEVIWKKYQEGLQLLKTEEAAGQQKKQDEEFEKLVLGVKPSEYFVQKGIQPGPDMGKAMGRLKKIIADNKDKDPDAIRALIAVEGL